VADRVHPPVHGVEATSADAQIDRIVAESERPELAPRDDAVLPAGQRGEGGVQATRSTLTATVPVNVERVGHGAMLTGGPCRRYRQIVTAL
jgi:hypothetical protein